MTRAALLPAAGTPLRVVDLDLAPPGPDEVQVRLHASGVCSDDLNVLDGTVDVPSPLVPGHEGAGVVEALGEGVRDLAVGDHVALSWAPYCGHCDECLRDLPHLCSTAWPMMLQGGLLDGTTRLSFGGAVVHHYCFLSSFSERAVVPARSCVRIPDDVPFEVAALLGCAVTSGVCAVWRTAQVRPGDRVAVFGLGTFGLLARRETKELVAAKVFARRNDDSCVLPLDRPDLFDAQRVDMWSRIHLHPSLPSLVRFHWRALRLTQSPRSLADHRSAACCAIRSVG